MTNISFNLPNSKFLRKKPWHKFVWLISFIYCLSSLYSVVIIGVILLDRLGLINIRGIETFLTLPMLIPLLPLMVFLDPSKAGSSSSLINNSFVGLFLLMAYFAFSTALPSIIYKILLNGIYGTKWQK